MKRNGSRSEFSWRVWLCLILTLCAPQAVRSDDPVIRLRIVAMGAPVPPLEGLKGARLVTADEPADLVWLAGEGMVMTGEGEIAAETITPQTMQPVIDKWNAVRALSAAAREHPLELAIEPAGVHHTIGRRIAFRSGPLPHPHVVVFNLSSSGKVQFLYPQDGDPAELRPGSRYELPLRVSGPPGADHLVVVASERPLPGLAQALETADARDVPRLLADALKDSKHRIGMAALFAAPAN